MKKVWKLEDHIKTRNDLVLFIREACSTEMIHKKPTAKDMEWIAIACKDFVRIARMKGWID